MHARRIMANLRVADIDAAKDFYIGYLGLSTEEFNMGWVARYSSPDAYIQLVTRDATAPEDSAVSVHPDDIDTAYQQAKELGYEIVHPLTTEPWGVRRFFVRAPDGNVINVVDHHDDGYTGTLVSESLRPGTVLRDIALTVTRIRRTSKHAEHWTIIDFHTTADRAAELAETMGQVLIREGGWYCDFHSLDDVFVVFSGKIFRYPRGDRSGRAEAEGYGRSVGTDQLDWPD
jgi:catechol 2,3-dioxygenase-like lactoylglutathione lyase family enzyme